jgi:peptidoglycan DL-endopeptidase CwlO
LRLTHGLRAFTLATCVAITGVTALSAPVAATDPTPTATPSTTTAPAPTPTPDLTAAATAPAPAATPAPTTSPAPTASAATLDSTTAPVPVMAAAVTAPAPAPRPNIGARIVGIALAQLHKRYAYGSAGPSAFDCSGLVRYAYLRAGVSKVLGGGHSALAMYRWALAHHLASSSRPQIGDVVVYGGGTHVGIYIGRGLVVSALNPRLGIRITALRGLTSRFTTFIHTRI